MFTYRTLPCMRALWTSLLAEFNEYILLRNVNSRLPLAGPLQKAKPVHTGTGKLSVFR